MTWEHRGPDRTGAETWVGVTMGRTYIIRTRDGIVTLLAQKWVEHGFESVDEAKAYAEGVA